MLVCWVVWFAGWFCWVVLVVWFCCVVLVCWFCCVVLLRGFGVLVCWVVLLGGFAASTSTSCWPSLQLHHTPTTPHHTPPHTTLRRHGCRARRTNTPTRKGGGLLYLSNMLGNESAQREPNMPSSKRSQNMPAQKEQYIFATLRVPV